MCDYCGPVDLVWGGAVWRCASASRDKSKKRKLKKYGISKKQFCELCGFNALDPCQLDIDHIDGNHSNNKISNLQTLCANCHRLKTKENGDTRNIQAPFSVILVR